MRIRAVGVRIHSNELKGHRDGANLRLLAMTLLPAGASFNATSDMTSMVDPAWRSETMPERVLIVAATAELEARRWVEDGFSAKSRAFRAVVHAVLR